MSFWWQFTDELKSRKLQAQKAGSISLKKSLGLEA